MNTSSHILMGRFLQQYAEQHYKIRLERKSFVVGNVLPDYCPSFLIRPHYLKNNAAYVHNTIRLLLSRRPSTYADKKDSHLLGVLCHFYADFFCYVHNDDFTGGLSEHIAYESRLHRYFEEHLGQFGSLRIIAQSAPAIRADDVYRQFETLHASYLLSRPSFGNDLLYAMMACIDLMVLTCGSAAAEKERMLSCQFDNLEAV